MKKRDSFLHISIFLLWLVIVIITGINHEPWADEAQAWLVARDNSYIELIRDTLKYEGHPILWYFILRTLYLVHFPYDLFYIIPIILSGLGVYLLLFKTKLPIVIKVLFPFTFYILYQNTVIARSYALLLPILMSIVVIYSTRLSKPITYVLLLILLLCSDSYSFILSSVLFVFYIYDICYSKQINKKNISLIVFYVLYAVLTILYLRIPADYSLALPSFTFSLNRILSTFVNGYYDVSIENIKWFNFVFPFLLYLLSLLVFCKNLRQILFFVFVNLSIVIVLSMVISRYWHYGYIITVLIFTIAILCEENKIVLNKNLTNILFCIVFALLVSIQIKWGITAINFDFSNKYSASKDVSQFIRNNRLEQYKIHGLGYSLVAAQPYFKHNLFDNYETSYYKFNESFEKKLYLEGLTYAPVIILDPSFYTYFENYIKSLTNYNVYTFMGSLRTKSEVKPTVDLFVFVDKNILH